MGKSLIIKGADFSANGIAPEFVILKSIITTSTTQAIASIVDIPANAKIVATMATPATQGAAYKLFGKEFPQTVSSRVFYAVQFNNLNDITGCLFYVNSTDYKTISTAFQDGLQHTLTLDRTGGQIDNGTKVSAYEQTSIESIPKETFAIFGKCSYNDTLSSSIGVKCYGCKVFSDRDNPNSLILDAIPVKRLSDNAICLYDKISGEYLLTEDGTNPDYEELD